MNNLLITTFSEKYEILLEMLGFTNFEKIPFFKRSKKYQEIKNKRKDNNFSDVNNIWIVSTEPSGEKLLYTIKEKFNSFVESYKKLYNEKIKIYFFYTFGVKDIITEKDSNIYSDLVFRLVYFANLFKKLKQNKINNNKSNKKDEIINKLDFENIYICPTQGRKLMSSAIEQAGFYFGNDGLFHIADNLNRLKNEKSGKLKNEQFEILKKAFNDIEYLNQLSAEFVDCFEIIVLKSIKGDENCFGEHFVKDGINILNKDNILSKIYSNKDVNIIKVDRKGKPEFYEYFYKFQNKMKNTFFNFSNMLLNLNEPTNFRILYTLSGEKIEKLKKFKIGKNHKDKKRDIIIIKKLPKADLHCHIGGILDIKDLVFLSYKYFSDTYQKKVSKINKSIEYNKFEYNKIEDFIYKKYVAENHDAKNLFYSIKKILQNNKLEKEIIINKINKIIAEFSLGSKNQFKNKFNIIENLNLFFYRLRQLYKINKKIIEYFDPVFYFIFLFFKNVEILDSLIFNKYVSENNFSGIGINRYLKLGDIQGSTIYISKKGLKYALEIFFKKLKKNNIKYIELRGSFNKYAKFYSEREVIENIIDSIKKYAEPDIMVRLIIIINRGHDNASMKKAVKFLKILKTDYPESSKYIAGYDVAGVEGKRSAQELRPFLIDAMKDCSHITIHAGETESVESVWEAVYHLNAERIGHGLNLDQNLKLKEKIRDQKVSIELCPSSNYQIVGFKDYLKISKNNKKNEIINGNNDSNYDNSYDDINNRAKQYPLKGYLNYGLKITINTDNPGISRTNITNEFYKAAVMTDGGLSLWDILLLIKNSFKSVFAGYEVKQKLIKAAEKEIVEILNKINE